MEKETQFILILLLFYFNCQSQESSDKFNLNFENYSHNMRIIKGWNQWGDYSTSIDSSIVYSGKYSGQISSGKNDGAFGSLYYYIPAKYSGKSITLEGFMKIKNVEHGFAGLILRIDGKNGVLEFDNMESQNISGTTDWKKYSITLSYPENAKSIFLGGIITGTGEAWFDDFKLTIDGKDVQTLATGSQKTFKAELDDEFNLNSKVKIPELSEQLIENLELIGRVWGFLKYYHPKVGNGDYNWDFELFRILPKYLETKSIKERNEILLDWIGNYGVVKECTTCKKTENDAFHKPDLNWLNVSRIEEDLKNKLLYIYENRHQGEHYYIGLGRNGNPDFLNEENYYSMEFNDDGFKLLALYRYWNIIHYFFPYKYLTDEHWDKVLVEFIPQFINSKTKIEYEKTITKLISKINDTHATSHIGFNNIQNLRGKYHSPFKTKFIDNKLVVVEYYNPELITVAHPKVGDVITHINQKSVEAIVDSVGRYYPASNETAKLRDISKDILRSQYNKTNLVFYDENKTKSSTILLFEDHELNKNWYDWTDEESFKILEGNIGYINLKKIKENDIKEIKSELRDTKGVIIDIRNYPSLFVPFKLGSYFVTNKTPFVKFTKMNISNPGEFEFTEPLFIIPDEKAYSRKLVVLVNELTQSMAEYTAMAFRAGDNTTIIGSTTAGADGNVSGIYLPGGLLTRISGIGVYYPDGTKTQRIGIVPDIVVKPTIEDIRSGNDPLIKKAIEVINEL